MKRSNQQISVCGRLAVAAGLLLLAGCGGDNPKTSNATENKELIEKNKTIEELYNTAYESMARQSYKKAVEEFSEVERQHPYSEWASQAQVMAAYAAYRGGQFEDAVVILDRFVKLHPTHPSAPYAFYLTALCYYTQISDVGRDQKMSERARDALRDVVERFPDTDYARDAKLKLDLTDDHLAGKEMEIGRYYLKRQDYSAAINRFKYVIDHFQTTSHTPEALHRMVESYLRLGVVGEAKKYASVLGYNYPGSDWYKYSYEMMQGNLTPEEKKSVFDKYLKL